MSKSIHYIGDITERLEYLVHPSNLKRFRMRRCTGDAIIPKGSIPPSFSLVDKVKVVYDQGRSSSCTACTICSAYTIMNDKDPVFRPSRYYIYAREREMMSVFKSNKGAGLTDTGAYEKDGLYWAETVGLCPESKWPSTGDINKVPPISCDKEASSHRIKGIVRVPGDINCVRGLVSKGYPVLIAIQIYSSIVSPTVSVTGVLPMPSPMDVSLGGHECLVVGYDDNTGRLLVLNSWGKDWGYQPEGSSTRGYFWLPYNYISKYCVALYTIESVIIV